MRQIYIFTIFLFGFNSFSQTTYIPDNNFEQELINLGYDDVLDDYVLTANIVDVFRLQLEDLDIYDLTGIEEFVSLTWLDLSRNFLPSLDVSQNINLELLDCSQIDTLVELNIQNGNNTNLRLGASSCPNLVCVQVDDIAYVTANLNNKFFFTGSNQYTLRLDCSTLATEDIVNTQKNVLLYPNPSNDFLFLLGVKQETQYKIFNSLGSNIKSGFLYDDKKIDIKKMIPGLYFLKFGNENTIKFIKN